MKIQILILMGATVALSAQAVFHPTPRPKDLVERYFKEDPNAAPEKTGGLSIRIDDEKGRIDYSWKEKGKRVHRTKFMENRVHGSIECLVTGESLPLQFAYRFAFESPCKERYIHWMIASLSLDSKRFSTPNGTMIRMEVQGFDIAVFPEFSKNPGKFEGYPGFLGGRAGRSNRNSLDDFKFTLTYQAYFLPRIVPCGMSGGREEIDSPFYDGDLLGWGDFLWKNKIQWSYESRMTLGPGLDAEKVSDAEMVDELIRNVLTAKDDKWIDWAKDGGKALLGRLQEIKAITSSSRKSELTTKIEDALRQIEAMKGKGRSEFYSMVRIYLVLLKARLSR